MDDETDLVTGVWMTPLLEGDAQSELAASLQLDLLLVCFSSFALPRLVPTLIMLAVGWPE